MEEQIYHICIWDWKRLFIYFFYYFENFFKDLCANNELM